MIPEGGRHVRKVSSSRVSAVPVPRQHTGGDRLPDLTQRTILMLKQTHPEWGCQRISDLLVRGPALPASASAVARVLHEAGYEGVEVPTHSHPDKVRRFERARPNQLWETDLFTFVLKRQNRRVHLVAFLDDHSRFIVSYGLHATASTAMVVEALEAAIASYGPAEEILTDNGPQYVTWRGTSQFAKHLQQRGIKQIVAHPRRPQTLGKIERFWGTLWREFLEAAPGRGQNGRCPWPAAIPRTRRCACSGLRRQRAQQVAHPLLLHVHVEVTDQHEAAWGIPRSHSVRCCSKTPRLTASPGVSTMLSIAVNRVIFCSPLASCLPTEFRAPPRGLLASIASETARWLPSLASPFTQIPRQPHPTTQRQPHLLNRTPVPAKYVRPRPQADCRIRGLDAIVRLRVHTPPIVFVPGPMSHDAHDLPPS